MLFSAESQASKIVDKVFLNGQELQGCVSADTTLGEVTCVTYKDGLLVVKDDGQIATHTLKGDVVVSIKPGMEAVAQFYEKFPPGDASKG
jgi:hypothetical protein